MIPIVHPSIQSTVDRLRQHPPQSLLLGGPEGVGLLTIARHLSGSRSILLKSAGNTINVEMIRDLYEQTRSKHIARQFVIIDGADHMSKGAQNAFLKLLEEPGSSIFFILTAHDTSQLLPTILSRVQSLSIPKITPEQSQKLVRALVTDTTKQRQLTYIAEGLPAEIHRLVSDETYFATRAKTVTDARELLKGDPYARLLVTTRYTDREAARALVATSTHILLQALQHVEPTQKTIRQLEQLEHTDHALLANHNVRLALLRLVI